MTQHIVNDKRAIPKYKYSPAETALLKLLPSNGKTISTTDLTNRYYAKVGREVPYHGKIVVNTTMRSLMDKAKGNREPFKIQRARSEKQGKGHQGAPPYKYWRE